MLLPLDVLTSLIQQLIDFLVLKVRIDGRIEPVVIAVELVHDLEVSVGVNF